MKTKSMHPILAHRKKYGLTLEQFGLLIGVQKAAVCKWEGGNPVPPQKAIDIEKVTHGLIGRHELRPDLWEHPSSSHAS